MEKKLFRGVDDEVAANAAALATVIIDDAVADAIAGKPIDGATVYAAMAAADAAKLVARANKILEKARRILADPGGWEAQGTEFNIQCRAIALLKEQGRI